MVDKIKDYRWSSYNKFIAEYKGKNVEIDTGIIKSYFRNKKALKYTNEINNNKCLDYCKKTKYTDVQLKAEIQRKYPIKK